MLCSYKQKNNRLLTVHNLRSVVSTNDLSKGRFGWGGVGGGGGGGGGALKETPKFGSCEWLVLLVSGERSYRLQRDVRYFPRDLIYEM